MAYNDSMKLRDAVDSVESRVAYTDDKAFRSLQRDLQSVCTRVRRYYGLPEKMYLGTPVLLMQFLYYEGQARGMYEMALRDHHKHGNTLTPERLDEFDLLARKWAMVRLLSDTLRRVAEEDAKTRYEVMDRSRSSLRRELRRPTLKAIANSATSVIMADILRQAASQMSTHEIAEILNTELARKILEEK